jgi:hypothetical protein
MKEELDDVAGASDLSGVAKRPISRRAVGLGAVWSVPVILTAVAAPAAAASVAPDAKVAGTVTADKVAADQFGTKHVNFVLTRTNTGAAAGTAHILSVASDGIQGTQKALPMTVVVPVGSDTVVNFSYEYVGNAATANYTITYEVSGVTSTISIRV